MEVDFVGDGGPRGGTLGWSLGGEMPTGRRIVEEVVKPW